MFGLLDDEFYDDPQRRALMAFGTGLLSGGDANSRALASGFQGAVDGGLYDRKAKQKKLEDEQQREFRALQMRGMRGDLDAEDQSRQLQSSITNALRPGSAPAASMDGGAFYGAAGKHGLPTDNATLNKIVAGVNRGMTPDEAALAVKSGGQQKPFQPQDQMTTALNREMVVRQQMGDHKGAQAIFDKLNALTAVKDTQTMMINGKPHRVAMNAQGQWGAPSPYEVAKEVKVIGSGTANDVIDPLTGELIKSYGINQSPDSQATERTAKARNALGYASLKQRAASGGGGAEGMLPDDVAEQMAEQAMVGDTSVFQNLGRGAQGAQNIIKVRTIMARKAQEAGETGADRAAKNAEFFGTKAGQRSAGTRIANVEMAVSEAQELVPLARSASQAVSRSGILPFGKAQMFIDNQTNSPEMRQFVAANNALVNVYSRAISPTGQPTVSDKEHARELLQTAYDDKSYQAVLDQMNQEMQAARKAPKIVRQEFSDSVTGRHGAPKAPEQKAAKPMDTMPPPNASNKGRTIKDTATGKRYHNPTGMKWEPI